MTLFSLPHYSYVGKKSFTDNFATSGTPVPGPYLLGARDGTAWTNPARLTSPIGVFGTQSGAGSTDDSIALINSSNTSFAPDQKGSITIYKDPTLINSGFHEVEVLLRGTMTSNNTQMYECNLSYGTGTGDAGDVSYQQIVKWLGPFNSYTFLSEVNAAPHPVNGAIFIAQIVGNTITTYLDNGAGPVFIQSTDITQGGTVVAYNSGQPGFGMFQQGDGINNKYGITSFTAIEI